MLPDVVVHESFSHVNLKLCHKRFLVLFCHALNEAINLILSPTQDITLQTVENQHVVNTVIDSVPLFELVKKSQGFAPFVVHTAKVDIVPFFCHQSNFSSLRIVACSKYHSAYAA